MKQAMQLVIVLCVVSVALAAKPEPAKENLQPMIVIPLLGDKTLLRFIVHNRGDTSDIVYDPFANNTRLVIVHPNGEKKEHGIWREMERPPEPLAPGKSVAWDVDIAQWVKMKEQGTYTVSFTVNGIPSDQLQFVQDQDSAPRPAGSVADAPLPLTLVEEE